MEDGHIAGEPSGGPVDTNYGQELLCLDMVGPGLHARVGWMMEFGTEAWVPSLASLCGKTHAAQGGPVLYRLAATLSCAPLTWDC